MKLRRFLALSTLTLCALCVAPAQAAEKRTVSLDDCLQQALQRNLDIQIQRINPEIARYNLRGAYGAYDPVFNVTFERSGSQEPGGLDDQNRAYTGTQSDTDGISGGIGGLLPWGLQYRVGGYLGNSSGILPLSVYPVVSTNDGVVTTNLVAYRPAFETSRGQVAISELRQPLMRNAWIDSTRLSIELDRASLRQSEYAFRQQLMATVTEVETTYCALVSAADYVLVQEKALELATRLLAENKKKVEVGAMAPLDEKQAEAEVAARRADLLSAQRAYEDQQNALKNLLTDDYAGWHGIELVPAAKLSAVPIGVQLSDSWVKGLTQRPEILEARVNLEKQDITLKYQKNQLWPQLDIYGSFGYSAGGGAREYSDLLPQFEDRENPFYSIGASFSVPLGNRSTRNAIRATKAAQAQALLSLKKLEQSIMVEIDNAVGRVKTSYQQVQATREQRRFAQAALDAEQKKLDNGKSTSFFVLQFQRDLVAAASSEIVALANYNIALARLSQAEASTLERLKLDVHLK